MLTTEAKSFEMRQSVITPEQLAALVKMTEIEAAQCGPLVAVAWLSIRNADGTLPDELTRKRTEANSSDILARPHDALARV